MQYIAATLEGLEPIAESEVKGRTISKGRVQFSKEKDTIKSALFSYQLVKEFEFKKEQDIYKQDLKLNFKGSFRVDCVREGNHKFSSQDIRKSLGELIYKKGFKVNLKDPETIIFVDIKDNKCFIGLNPKFHTKRFYRIRNTLGSINASIAYSMIVLAETKKSDKILDPFCTDGIILIEAGLLGCKDLYGLTQDTKNASINAKIAKVKINLDKENLDWIDTKFEEGYITKIITKIISPSKKISKSIAEEITKEFFYQAKYVLNKKGIMVILTQNKEIIEKFASEFEFKIIHTLEVKQGDLIYTILKLKRI